MPMQACVTREDARVSKYAAAYACFGGLDLGQPGGSVNGSSKGKLAI
jgi:hypothetical protein